jgi:hypothetical protein
MRNAYKILVRKSDGKGPLGNLGVDGKIGSLGRCGLYLSSSGYGPMAGSCEHGNEPSGSIKGGEFLD